MTSPINKVESAGLSLQRGKLLGQIAIFLLMSSAGGTLIAAPSYYTDRPTFEAALVTSVTDDYEQPVYGDATASFLLYDNATMSAFLGETEYETTGFVDWNLVVEALGNQRYCAGCNGSYRLSFQNTSVSGGGLGVSGVGIDIQGHELITLPDTPYYAFITFADATTADVALPLGASFFGVTAPELIESIHFGRSGGGATTGGSFIIDNLTIGSGAVEPLTYSIGGTVSGLSGTGLQLLNNGGDTLPVAALATNFTFTTELADGANYAVTVSAQPAGQTCSVTGGGNGDGSGTIASADVTDVAVACVDDVVPPAPAPATPVPTLSEWALIALAMLLAGVVFVRRKQLT